MAGKRHPIRESYSSQYGKIARKIHTFTKTAHIFPPARRQALLDGLRKELKDLKEDYEANKSAYDAMERYYASLGRRAPSARTNEIR